MAEALVINSQLTTLLIGLVLVHCLSAFLPSAFLPSASTVVAAVHHSAASTHSGLIQPVLTGFRCEGNNEVTSDGVVIIEADSHVRVTLFGEYFTTETIVGFTSEFVPQVDVVDQMISKNGENSTTKSSKDNNSNNNSNIINQRASTIQRQLEPNISAREYRLAAAATETSNQTTTTTTTSSPSTPTASEQSRGDNSTKTQSPDRTSVRSAPPPASPHLTNLTEAQAKLRKRRRRLLDGRSYDCTDYDRVKSYKLREENIITPNVAVLTIKLPELSSLSSTGMYYYFCLKQPPIPSELLAFEEATAVAAEAAAAASSGNQLDDQQTTALSLMSSRTRIGELGANISSASRQHIWVHQGDEWWLMIKVEPPILSIANDCILIILLLFLSAVTSGLNLGLMSLDMNELAVISTCGDQRERSYARTIAPLRKRGNYLLCSLLLGNVMVNSTLTVILEEMTSGVVAVIGSTLAIVVLGEIVPQAFCARQGLAIGAKTIYLTYAFMIITFPLSYPISCLLDCILGAEKGHVYDREKLMEFIRITGNHTNLDPDEVAIISGALKIKKIRVDHVMTKLEDVFMLPIDCMLDRKTIRSIIEKGYSRIPVYEFGDRKQIVALILAKDLALLDPDDQMPLASMLMYCKHPLIFIEDTATLDVALNEFKTGKSHMAIVRQIYDDGEVDKYYEAIGVVTLEDVIEEVLQTEINDETDTLSDNRRKRRRTEAQVAHLVDELILETPTKLK